MLATRDIVRFSDHSEVPPLLRGHFAEIFKVPKSGPVSLSPYPWVDDGMLVKLSRRFIHKVEPDEAARLRWAYAKRGKLAVLAPSIKQARSCGKELERAIQNVLGSAGLSWFWACESAEAAVSVSRHIHGSDWRRALSADEKRVIEEKWTALLAAQTPLKRAVNEYLEIQ